MSDQLNIFVRSTASESPWSNGMTERDNAILGNKASELLIDESNEYPIEIIVAWALTVKSALHSCYGYSPYQPVFVKTQTSIIAHWYSTSLRGSNIQWNNCQLFEWDACSLNSLY